jgi:hypothetical protein
MRNKFFKVPEKEVPMALACTWAGYADSNIGFSEFFGADHTLAVRFMLQFPRAYAGPMVSVNGGGVFMLGQANFQKNPGDPPDLILQVGGSSIRIGTTIPAGTWHHLVSVRTSNVFRLYLDGVQVGSSLNAPASGGPTGTLRLGKDTFNAALDGGGNQFYGFIDDVAVFNVALSDTAIKNLAAARHLSGTEVGLLAGFVFGYKPAGGLPAKLSRPFSLSYGATICDVSAGRENTADEKKLPLASTSFMHLPFLPGTQWEIKQGYQGQSGWTSHNGYAAFCLDFIVAEKGVSEADRLAKTNGKPFYAVAKGTLDTLQNVFVAGGPSNFMSVRHSEHEFGDYLHFPDKTAVVAVGDSVTQERHLADIGNTGTGPYHLHFAVTNLGEGKKNSGGAFVTIPAPFCNYEYSIDQGATWTHVIRGIPQQGQWVRRALSISPARFSAVWCRSTEREIQVYDWAYKDLRAKYDELWPKGWRLKLLSPYVVGGQARYAAVWKPGTEGEIQVYDWALKDVRAKYDELWPKGWRLKILAPYVLNGQVLFAAVWTQSTEGEIQVYDWAYKDVRAKYDELWPKGWRLKLLSPYVVNGQVRYAAVWKPGTEGEIQVYDWAYKDMRAKYDELWSKGWRLKLLSPYVVNSQLLYAAVWRPGTEDELQIYGWDYADLRAKYDGLWNRGWRLVHLSPYVL